jgi:hypothetical protein
MALVAPRATVNNVHEQAVTGETRFTAGATERRCRTLLEITSSAEDQLPLSATLTHASCVPPIRSGPLRGAWSAAYFHVKCRPAGGGALAR